MKLACIAAERLPNLQLTPMIFKVWAVTASESVLRSAGVSGVVLRIW